MVMANTNQILITHAPVTFANRQVISHKCPHVKEFHQMVAKPENSNTGDYLPKDAESTKMKMYSCEPPRVPSIIELSTQELHLSSRLADESVQISVTLPAERFTFILKVVTP